MTDFEHWLQDRVLHVPHGNDLTVCVTLRNLFMDWADWHRSKGIICTTRYNDFSRWWRVMARHRNPYDLIPIHVGHERAYLNIQLKNPPKFPPQP